MTNAIKYILNKKNLMQKDLVTLTCSKQYVSKVINRQFRMPVDLINSIVALTNVPERFFVDSNGLCRQCNAIEIQQLDNFLEEQIYKNIDSELQYTPSEVELADRERFLKLNIAKLQREIRKDIHSVSKDVCDQVDALEEQEANFDFYKDMLSLHKSCLISNQEWMSLLKAFKLIEENAPECDLKNENTLVYGMYILLKNSRELNAIKQKNLIREIEELFGSKIAECEN